MNRVELRKLSLEFRRISSNFLNSTDDTADVNLSRFVNFITENEILKNYISNKIKDVEYDFEECFDIGCSDWADYKPPKDEACHIKAAYDYLLFINDNEKVNVRGQSMRYCWSSRKINDNIQSFIDMAFKPLIDYINDQLSMDMIVLDEEGKTVGGNTFIQQIGTVNGSANQQVSGVINSYNTNNDATEILALIDKLLPALEKMQNVDADKIDSVKDDLEVVQEQLKAETPKKSRLKKALDGIKKFVGDFSMKLAVSLAASAVTGSDWSMLIQQIESFIGKL